MLGNATAQVPAWLGFADLEPAPAATVQNFANDGQGGSAEGQWGTDLYGYNWRFVHQGSPAGNVNAAATGTPAVYGLVTNMQLSGNLSGNTAQFGDTTRETVLQMNRNVSAWLVGPRNGATRWNAGSINIGYHSGNAPGSAGGGTPSEIRLFTPDRISLLNPAGQGINDTPTVVNYFSDNTLATMQQFRVVPGTYDALSPPTAVNGSSEITNNVHAGFWVEDTDNRFFVNDVTANPDTEQDPGITANTLNAPSDDFWRVIRNFRYDFDYSEPINTGVETVPGETTMLVAEQITATFDWRNWLHDHDRTTAPQTATGEVENIPAGIRAYFQDGDPKGVAPITIVNNNLAFARTTNFVASGNIFYDASGIDIPVNNTLTLGNNAIRSITGFAFSDNNVTWGTVNTLNNFIIDGGNHTQNWGVGVGQGLQGITFTSDTEVADVTFGADTNITNWDFTGRFIPNAASAVTITLTEAQAASLQVSAGTVGNITYDIIPDEVTFDFNIDPNFRGRVALAQRTGGLAGGGTTVWTLIGSILDMTAGIVPFPTITNRDALFNSGESLYVVTVGSQYSLTFTEVPVTHGAMVPVGTTLDVNYNIDAFNALPNTVTSALDVAEGDIDGDGTLDDGTIVITIGGADIGGGNTLDGGQTNAAIGFGRNDVDYITEILDGGHTADFVSFESQTTTEITVDVIFNKPLATSPQQGITSVTGYRSASFDGINPDVVHFDAAAGLSRSDMRIVVADRLNAQSRALRAASTIKLGIISDPEDV